MTATPAPAGGASPQVPLSVGQEAMWISWQLDPEQWTHIVPIPLGVVHGVLDCDRLRQAVATLAEAYPQLRARVVRGAGGYGLSWTDAPAVPVTEHAVAGDPADALRGIWQRPFDLRTGPLARVDIVRGAERTILLLTVHHLVFDGASVLILLEALRRAYAMEPVTVPSQVEALTAFAARSRELADTPAGDELRDYWQRAVGNDVSDFELPTSVDQPGYAVLSTAVPPDLVPQLRARATDLGVSYFTVLFGAYFALLRRYAGEDDLLVSIPYHGRSDERQRDLVGYFVNALPVRRRLIGSESLADLVRGLRGDVRATLAHGDLPLPSILRGVGLTGPAAHARTHQTVFQYWHAGLRADVDVMRLELRSGDDVCTLSLLDIESSADYALAVMVREDSGGTHLLWKNPSGSVGRTLLHAMSADYVNVLSAIVANPDAHVADVTEQVDTPTGPVNLRELTALLEDHAAVRRAVVTPAGGDSDLAVRVVLEHPVEAEELRAWLAERLGTPAPRTRFDLGTRPTPDEPAATIGADVEGGERDEDSEGGEGGSLPIALALWEETLGYEGISPDDSFFELGGHSLLAESLVLAVSEYFDIDVSLRILFDAPRLSEFAAQLDALIAEAAAAAEPTAAR